MFYSDYIEPVFRPPSEWQSYILQVTNGCSWNRCTFCEMYQQPQKQFNLKPIEQIAKELKTIKTRGLTVRRVFLADGDAMVLSVRRLKDILAAINKVFPDINRISAYCLPRNISNKTVAELTELRQLGLGMLYVGCETGSDTLLNIIDKGETFESSKSALNKIHVAGIKSSVMILNGLGGHSLSAEHAVESARLMNETQPDFLSTLVLSFPNGKQRFTNNFTEFKELNQTQLFQEMSLFISELELKSSIFRSDHASNYLALKGVLNKDKEKLLAQLDLALNKPEQVFLRPESMRGL